MSNLTVGTPTEKSVVDVSTPNQILPDRSRSLHETVKAFREAGISIHPPTEDGVKRPLGESWKQHQKVLASDELVSQWYGPQTGIGLICGAVSRGLEAFEFDDIKAYNEFKVAAEAVGLGDLVERLEAGYLESSPGGGIHWLYYTDEVRGNTKLAQSPGLPDPKTGKPTIKTLIETRGEGGYIIVAPSNGKVHPTGGRYQLLRGAVETIVALGWDEAEALRSLAKTFDRMPKHPDGPGRELARPPRRATSIDEDLRPGDDYNAQMTWDDLFIPRGWKKLHTHGEATYWRRPGKSEGWSATTNVYGSDLLYVFSTSTEFEAQRTYDKFGAYAVLEAGGNLELAAKALRDQGYGSKSRTARVARLDGPARPQSRSNGSPTPSITDRQVEAAESLRPNEADDDPHRLARLHLERNCSHPDRPTLVFHQGQFFEWDVYYRFVPEEEMRARLTNVTKEEFDRLNQIELAAPTGDKKPPKVAKVTTGLVKNMTQALSGYSLLDGQQAAPCWLSKDPGWKAEEVFPARNALVHLPTFAAGDWKDAIRRPTPNFFCPYATDYDFDPKALEPSVWLDLIHNKYWPDDPQSVASLQEWFGYHLTSDTRQQKIGLLIGPRRCGKGTIARVIRAMIGALNVCNPKLSSLGTQFGSAVLIGKLAAIITDARLSGRSDIAQIVENLLAISGEDAQTIHRKHQADWSGKLMAKFTIISNETPMMLDNSGALPGRMLIWKFTKSFYGQEDTLLFDKLLLELPGILLWSIRGWKRLRERGHFIQPETGQALVDEMEELSSPVGSFVKECCEVDPESRVDISRIFAAWRSWCERKGRLHPGEESVFGRNLRTVVPNIETKQRRESGEVVRCYKGIDLKPPHSF